MRPPDLSEEIERLVERGARDPRTHTFARLADLYRKVGEMDRALEVIEAGLRHHPHYLNARLVHARLLRDLGRSDEAVAAFERVLEIDSENRVARAALDELTGRPDEEPVGEAAEARAPGSAPDPPALAPSTGWLARLDADWRHVVVENGGDGPSSRSSEAEDGATAPDDAEEVVAAAGSASFAGGAVEEAVEEAVQEIAAPSGIAPPGEAAAAPDIAAPEEALPPEEAAPEEAAPERTATPEETTAARPSTTERELETATLARLYVSQGLHDQAVAIYERLLARDPYNARLAAALEEARRAGSRRGDAGRPTAAERGEPARAALREIPTAAPPGVPARPEAAGESVPPLEAASTAEPSGEPIGPFLQQLLEGRAPMEDRAATGRRWPDWLRKIGVAG